MSAEPYGPTDVVVFAGLFALLCAVPEGTPLLLLTAALCGLAPWLSSRAQSFPWALLVGTALIGAPLLLLLGLPLIFAALVGLCALAVHRRLARRGPGDDRASLLLGTLMVVLAVVADDSPWMAVALLLWAVALPLALLRAQLEGFRGSARDGGRVQRWGLAPTGALLLLAVPVFLALPRLRAGVATPSHQAATAARTGFSDEVRLDAGPAVLLDSPATVFRASVSPSVEGSVYFRGLTLDHFDGETWRRSDVAVASEMPEQRGAYEVDVVLEDGADGVLFTAGELRTIAAPLATQLAEDGVVRIRPSGPLTYRFTADGPLGSRATRAETPSDLQRYRVLPRDRDPRLRALALSLAGSDGAPEERVTRLSDALRDNYGYTRLLPERPSEAPLSTFLFDDKEGHCEYFAAGLAVLAREVGLPSRLVNGFVASERSPVDGSFLVREAHAHAWTEVWIDGRWRVFDATPGPGAPLLPRSAAAWQWDRVELAWREVVLGYDARTQRSAVAGVGRAVTDPLGQPDVLQPGLTGLAVLIALVALLLGVGRRLAERAALGAPQAGRAVARGAVARSHDRARLAVEGSSRPAPDHLPPVAAAQWLVSQGVPGAEALLELAWLHYAVRYGGGTDDELAPRATALQAQVVAVTEARPTR